MPKQSKRLQQAMQSRNPLELRQAVKPIDILAAAAEPLQEQHGKTERIERTEKPMQKSDVEERSNFELPKSDENLSSQKSSSQTTIKKRTRKARVYSDKDIRSLLEERKRQTERYSFEIFTDQKQDIETLRDLYEQRTGKKLSASRLIREVLDSFLPEALATFSKEPSQET